MEVDEKKRKTPEPEEDTEMTQMHQLFDAEDEILCLVEDLHAQYVPSVQQACAHGKNNPVCEDRDMLADFDPAWHVAFDDVNGGPLDPAKVMDARRKEIEVINEVGVWQPIRRTDVPTGFAIVSGRWVHTN